MSENKTIILVFENQEKVIKFPDNFNNLKSYFKHVFNQETSDDYNFNYEDENNKENNIKDDESFGKFLESFNKKKIDKLIIKKENNILYQSDLFLSNVKSDGSQNQLSVLVEKSPENNEENNDIEQSNLTLNYGDDDYKKNTFVKSLEEKSQELENSFKLNNENNSNISKNDEKTIHIQEIIINDNNNNNEIEQKQENDYKKELESKISQLQLKISQLEQEKFNLNNQNQQYQSTILGIEEKNNKREKELEKKMKEQELLYKEKINKLDIENSQYKNQLSQMNKSLNEQKSSILLFQKKNADLENDNLLKNSELDETKKQIVKLRNENLFINDEFKKLKSQDNNLKTQISNLEKENSKLKTELSNYEKSLCKTVHKGTKCMICFKEPIIGYRYKCSQCNEYNLCQKCHEKNGETSFHPHFFYRYEKYNENINIYSYKNLSPNNKVIIFKGRSNTKIKMILQNDKFNKWPDNTKLIWDKYNSEIQTEDVQLKGLKPSEVYQFNIYFNNLQNLNIKEYKVFFDFNVNGINFGDKLKISIDVIEGQQILNKFKAKYKIPYDYQDDIIYEVLEEKNCDFEKALFKLYFK